MRVTETDRQGLHGIIDRLSDEGIKKLKPYAAFVCCEDEMPEPYSDEPLSPEEADAQIAALEARYGTMPNAETILAMNEAAAGLVEPVTLEEIRARCGAIHSKWIFSSGKQP